MYWLKSDVTAAQQSRAEGGGTQQNSGLFSPQVTKTLDLHRAFTFLSLTRFKNCDRINSSRIVDVSTFWNTHETEKYTHINGSGFDSLERTSTN
jgi:hypothetical protein